LDGRLLFTAVAAVAALAGPGGGGPSGSVRVLAAASLVEAFTEMAAAYGRAHPGQHVELTFAGSQVLATQIEHGTSADVFASADMAHAEALARGGLLRPARTFARNKLVVVAPARPGRVRGLEDLSRPGVRLVLAAPNVPAGRYAGELLSALEARGGYGAGFRARVEANVVSRETSVRAVLAKVALGEADAGIVYRTDAASSDKVREVGLPAGTEVQAEYAIGVLVRSPAGPRAEAFVAFVLGPAGRSILLRHGFGS
jgi:molybdate transport system substrate-binding protein